jgi:hypothetical protein
MPRHSLTSLALGGVGLLMIGSTAIAQTGSGSSPGATAPATAGSAPAARSRAPEGGTGRSRG